MRYTNITHHINTYRLVFFLRIYCSTSFGLRWTKGFYCKSTWRGTHTHNKHNKMRAAQLMQLRWRLYAALTADWSVIMRMASLTPIMLLISLYTYFDSGLEDIPAQSWAQSFAAILYYNYVVNYNYSVFF